MAAESLATTHAPLPPGTTGLPLVGETLDFLRDPFAFVDERIARFGPVARTKILGRDAVVVAGPEAAEKFVDPRLVQRSDSMPFNLREIFAGESLPLLDGVVHRARKQQVMSAFGREAIAAYLPAARARIERTLSRWAEAGEVRAIPELKKLSIEIIGANFLGHEPGPEVDRLVSLYGTLLAGAAALPIALPGTTYSTALRARDRILELLREEVRRHRVAKLDDGLARMLAAKTEDGSTLSDEDAALEMHHVVLAGYIVFSLFAAALQALDRHADVREPLRDEVRAAVPNGAVGPETFRAMPLLDRFVKEIKRTTRVVPVVFGLAKESFLLHGARVPRGYWIVLGLSACNEWKDSFRDPLRFDPSRFAEGRDEGRDEERVYVPQGAGQQLGHKCAGKDYSSVLVQLFTIELLRAYDYSIPSQDLSLRKVIPPEPKDGLRLAFRRR